MFDWPLQSPWSPPTATETKTLISMPSAINLVLQRIDQITRTIILKCFISNWQYFTALNRQTLTLHDLFFLYSLHGGDTSCHHEDCHEDTHIVYHWPGNTLGQDENIPTDKWHVEDEQETFQRWTETDISNFYTNNKSRLNFWKKRKCFPKFPEYILKWFSIKYSNNFWKPYKMKV